MTSSRRPTRVQKAASGAEKAVIARLQSPAGLGKPEALSGAVLTLRMIDAATQSAAQAAASRAATEALALEVRQLRGIVRQVRQDWLRPVLYGFGGAISGGALVAFAMVHWLTGHY
jgi:hypothetical protein